MPKPSWNAAALVARPRGRPRKAALPAARFAPIRLADAPLTRPGAAPMAAAYELLFPDGLTLRVAPGADPAGLERLVAHLRRRVD